MIKLKESLIEQQKRLEYLKSIVDEGIDKLPAGTMRIASSKKQKQYMYRETNDGSDKSKEKYLKSSETKFIQDLSQKAYYIKLKKLIDRRLKQIKRLNNEYYDDEIENVFYQMHPDRRCMVTPIEKTWEQTVSEWIEKPYQGKEFRPDNIEIYTKNGERVRSKSEKILADMLYDRGVAYKYECPLQLKGFGIVYPDFTMISKKTGKEVYWEHDGMMDDSEYAVAAIRKIDAYVKNGIFPGERLIITYEASGYVMNDKTIIKYIDKYLK